MVHKHSHQVSYAKQYALGICEQFSNLQNLGQTSHALIHLSHFLLQEFDLISLNCLGFFSI